MVFSRRRFLCGATAMGLSIPLLMQRLEADAATTDKILVIIDQNGGNDMFNTVVPAGSQYGTYSTLRGGSGGIALQQSDLAATMFDANISTPANQSSEFAFHPHMTEIRNAWSGGNLALVTGVGLPPTTAGLFDHEYARFAWQTGTTKGLGLTDVGWCGLMADQITPAGGATLPAMIASYYSDPQILSARNNTALILGGGSLSGFAPNLGAGGSQGTQRQSSLNGNDAYALASMPGEFARSTAEDTEAYVAQIAKILSAEPLNGYATNYAFGGPGTTATYSGLMVALEQVARIILSGAPSRIFYVNQGGYDTHSNQINAQYSLLGELSAAMTGFNAYLNQSSNAAIGSKVVSMTYTDFGRRPNVNSTAGTDHGTTQISFVMGASVIGGMYGAYPNLSALDTNGNAIVGIDFRNEISDIVQAMGADPTAIVGQTYPKIGFI